MKKILLTSICLLGLVSLRAGATGCTDLEIDEIDLNAGSAMGTGTKNISVTIKENGPEGCDWFFTVDYGGASTAASRRLANGSYTIPIQLYRDSGLDDILKKFPDVNDEDDVVRGSFNDNAASRTSSKTIRAKLASGLTYERFGNYSDTFIIQLYEGEWDSSYSFKDSRSFNLTYDMAKKIDLSLVNTSGAYNASDTTQTINFGSMALGVQRAMDIVLKYNAGYKIKFSSQRNGNLKHSSLADTVPYSATVGGNLASLGSSSSTPAEVANGTGISGSTGTRFPVVFTIGALGTARAGTYSDTITVTVESNE